MTHTNELIIPNIKCIPVMESVYKFGETFLLKNPNYAQVLRSSPTSLLYASDGSYKNGIGAYAICEK